MTNPFSPADAPYAPPCQGPSPDCTGDAPVPFGLCEPCKTYRREGPPRPPIARPEAWVPGGLPSAVASAAFAAPCGRAPGWARAEAPAPRRGAPSVAP